MKVLPLKYAYNTAAHSQNRLYIRTNQSFQTAEEPKAPASKPIINHTNMSFIIMDGKEHIP
jgi:hypothetical protein